MSIEGNDTIGDHIETTEAAQELLEASSEALIITVCKGDHSIAVRHKLKNSGGVLNDYLVSLLAQLLQSARNEPTQSHVRPTAANTATGRGS